MQKSIFITGNSSGIGYALSKAFIKLDWQVYGLSRRGCQGLGDKLHDIRCDLARREEIDAALRKLLSGVTHLDIVLLNAGVLGLIQKLSETDYREIETIMDINVWANKAILDWLLRQHISIEQVVAVSSGAAVNGNKGWSGYSLSKATLNMLIKLYAAECPNTHFSALAPGLVDTAMQDYLCDTEQVSAEVFPSLEKLRKARGTDRMPTPDEAAADIINVLPQLRQFDSGAFVDIRDL